MPRPVIVDHTVLDVHLMKGSAYVNQALLEVGR